LFSSTDIEDKNFVSGLAAYALKAEVNMWTAKALNSRENPNKEDLNTAISAIDEILNSSEVSFETVYADTFNRAANSAGEYIYANYFDYAEDGNNIFPSCSVRAVNLPSDVVDTFPHALVSEGLSSISYGDYIETLYDASDLRYQHNVFNVPDSDDQVITKFPGYIEEAENRRYWDNDIPIYRYSDMLLLKAEALNGLDNSAEAIVIVNQTRNRGGIGDYSGATDKLSVETEILAERARDLAFENKRWWDLCRAHQVAKYVPRFMENRGDDASAESVWDFYYWPISESMLLSNAKLEQTAGY